MPYHEITAHSVQEAEDYFEILEEYGELQSITIGAELRVGQLMKAIVEMKRSEAAESSESDTRDNTEEDTEDREEISEEEAEDATEVNTEHTVLACPECDSSRVNKRLYPEDESKAYRCQDCGEEFDEPVERYSRKPSNSFTEELEKEAEELIREMEEAEEEMEETDTTRGSSREGIRMRKKNMSRSEQVEEFFEENRGKWVSHLDFVEFAPDLDSDGRYDKSIASSALHKAYDRGKIDGLEKRNGGAKGGGRKSFFRLPEEENHSVPVLDKGTEEHDVLSLLTHLCEKEEGIVNPEEMSEISSMDAERIHEVLEELGGMGLARSQRDADGEGWTPTRGGVAQLKRLGGFQTELEV